jgi:hypothetical protein
MVTMEDESTAAAFAQAVRGAGGAFGIGVGGSSAIGWCRRRHGTRPRDDDEHEHGQCEALVTVRLTREALLWVGSFLLRANCKDEQPEPEQHECAVEACHPQQMRTVQARRLLDGDARSVLVRVPLLVREQVPYVSVPELALDEELLECDHKDLARALAQPFVGRHRVISGAYFRHECMEVSLCNTMGLRGGFMSGKGAGGSCP